MSRAEIVLAHGVVFLLIFPCNLPYDHQGRVIPRQRKAVLSRAKVAANYHPGTRAQILPLGSFHHLAASIAFPRILLTGIRDMSFSQELFDLMLENLDDRPTLAACALVARTWRQRSQALLLQKISLSTLSW